MLRLPPEPGTALLMFAADNTRFTAVIEERVEDEVLVRVNGEWCIAPLHLDTKGGVWYCPLLELRPLMDRSLFGTGARHGVSY